MKILIIGSKGMLGQEFMRQPDDRDVIGWTREDLDITNETAVFQKVSELKPQVIINCAAYNNVDKAEDEPEIANAINGEAVGYLARAAADCGATAVHFSTDYVFSGNLSLAKSYAAAYDFVQGYTEEDMPDPVSKYGESKVLGEQRLLAISQSRNLANWYIIRTSKLFGPAGTGATSKKSFPEMMLGFAKEKGRIEAIDAEKGSPTYVKDLAQTVLKMVHDGAPSGIYHITNSGSCTWYEYARAAVEFAGVNAEIIPVGPNRFPRKAKRPDRVVLLNTKLSSLRPWSEALEEFLTQTVN